MNDVTLETVDSLSITPRTLSVKKKFTTYAINPKTGKRSKQVLNTKYKTYSFKLEKATDEAIEKRRRDLVPSLVYKVGSLLYCTTIPDDIIFIDRSNLVHMCAEPHSDCHRLSAASDEDGGCAKVRNYATHLEKYDFIREGIETFNTKYDAFIVMQCTHYKKCPPRKQYTLTEINNLRLGLAQFVWEDAKSISQVMERKKRLREGLRPKRLE